MQRWRFNAALLVLSAFQACVAAEQTLRLATLEYPPYISQTQEGPRGLAVEIASQALARIGRTVKIDFYPIARGQRMVLTGEVDAYFSIKKTAERERTMVFPNTPLMRQDYVFFTPAKSRWRFDGGFESIAGARIGIVNATSYGSRFDSAVASGTFRKLEAVSDHETNFRKLLAHRIDAVICSRLVGAYYLKKLNGAHAVMVNGPTVETTLSYLVFARNESGIALARQFDQAMDEMARDGTIGRLTAAYPTLDSDDPRR
jgi:polar amino acid transport system substrate-binding protein